MPHAEQEQEQRSTPHRSSELRVLDDTWRERLPPWVPATWEPRGDVPKTVADCPTESTPCPHIRCPHHLWLVAGEDRPGRRVSPRDRFTNRFLNSAEMKDRAAVPTPPVSILRPATPQTCALRQVDRNPSGMRYEDIGALFGLTGERCRQIARRAMRKLESRRGEIGEDGEH